MKKSAALFSLLCTLHCFAWANYETGEKYFKLASYQAAQKEWIEAAAAGNSRAAYMLGLGLLSGKYFPFNETLGIKYLNEASQGGNGDATYALYVYAKSNHNVPLSDSIKLLESAASQGSRRAEFFLDSIRKSSSPKDITSDLDMLAPVHVTKLTKENRPAALKRGEQVYRNSCAACHSIGLLNAPKPGDAQRWAILNGKGFDLLVANAVNGFRAHPPRGGDSSLSGDEVRDAVEYMRQQ
ncbi:cytochrome c5 family protein [Oxalobacteraceae bacterium]|nr:cytochrome c5 family protein [Oxalobacteraceae bacterium]